jgi:hypothetical protein
VTGPDDSEPAGLTERLLELLIELARTVQRFGMYPEGHPSRDAGARRLEELVRVQLAGSGGLSLRVEPDRLWVGEAATDPANTLLAGFARRLYEHQVLRLGFQTGVTAEALRDLMGRLAIPVGRSGKPLGADLGELTLPGVEIRPIPFESYALAGPDEAGPGEEEADAAAFPGEADGAEEGDPELSGRVARLLGGLEEETKRRLAGFIQALLTRPEVAGSPRRAVELLRQGRTGLGEREAVALGKVIASLGRVPAGVSGAAVEAAVLYELALQLAVPGVQPPERAGAPGGAGEAGRAEGGWLERPEPLRLLQLSIELDEVSELTRGAAGRLAREGRLADVFDLLDRAPEGNRAMEAVVGWVARPRSVRDLLTRTPPDFASVDRLLPRLGAELVRPLLDALEEQVHPQTQDGIVERLVRIGPAGGPGLVEGLTSSSADVRLCVLKAILALPERPETFTLASSYGDPFPEIRRLALAAGMTSGQKGRHEALRAALRDPEEGIVRVALEELVRDCPSGLDRDLIAAAGDRLRRPAIRQAAIRALGTLPLDSTREALVEMTWEHKFFWINGLRGKSLEMLEALTALARYRAREPGVARILRAAARSHDPQIQACVRGREASP